MKSKTLKVISSLAVLSLVTSCGKDSGSSSSSRGDSPEAQREEAAAIDGSHIQGHYQAKFVTLNPHVNGTIPGSANFHRKDSKIFAYVRLFAGKPKAWHMQHVYTGGRCPTMKDDKNGDGFIDILEAEAVLGNILIPLDSDISSQTSGRRFFPLADLSGYYHYERITSFDRFLSDLQREDNNPDDDLVKLGPDTPLRLQGLTVMIQGVDETVDLPETVATKERRRAFQTLPIVCGVFKKMEDIPGSPYVVDSEVPGPIADVVEGQDRPADEEIPDTTGGSGSGTTGTGGSNESDDGDGPVSDGGSGTTGGSSGSSTTGSSAGGSSSGSSSGSTSGSSTTGGSSTGSTTSGTTSGSTSSGSSESSSSSSSGSSTTGGTTGESDTTTTTTTSSSSSSSSTGSTTGGSFGF